MSQLLEKIGGCVLVCLGCCCDAEIRNTFMTDGMEAICQGPISRLSSS